MKKKIITSLLLVISVIAFSACTKIDKSIESGDNQNTGDLYYQDGKYNKAVDFYERAIKEDSDGELYYKLALSYEKVGKKELAIETFNKAKEKSPYLSDKVDAKLKEIEAIQE